MGVINRWDAHGKITIPVFLLQQIESAFWMDCAPDASKIARLVAIIERVGYRNAYNYPALAYAIREAEDGLLFDLDEVYAIQRLRGWHRQRYGDIVVDA